ncbi:MAG: BREX-1 system adenine-specific DNA-methyltransferase PglX [Deltaproteobacteria bacterium]|nr:BREX-1 system adenine-specific DNA-methyltransferase PglX [Deltaproteobacteria bacterium]
MNLNALKSFAPNVRRQLIEAVGRKLDYVLTGDTPDLREKAKQRMSIKGKAEKDRTGLIERVAYTWFNRLAALRFLDARGWHPFLCRVITPVNEEETQPEILKLTRNGALPSELGPFTDPVRINDLLDGRIPSADAQGEVYRHLVLAACRYYHNLMPFLFEALDDETELLLPDDLLTEHSVSQGFRSAINDDDCAEVEIIGWLYQFYIAEKKDQVMARKSAVPTEDIPAVTQLFTPHWIVRYLVENSLGRLWLLNRPGSRLREHMPYYIEGETETDFLKITKPEEIRLLDPASGSGHMLTYSFDLLYLIYEEEGHAPSEIPSLILRHNLFGLEICPRAAQLAQFALVCKAREKSRSAFRNPVQPQVICLEDVEIASQEMTDYLRLTGLRELFTERVLRQVYQFRDTTSTFGSLIQPVLTTSEISILKSQLANVNLSDDLLLQETHRKVIRAIDQAEMLSQRYHIVVANPPYMGDGGYNAQLKEFVEANFPDGMTDLYGAFILRNLQFVVPKGLIGMITIPNWMFLQSFEQLRSHLLDKAQLDSLIFNGRGVWGSDFGSCSFTARTFPNVATKGVFKRLFKKQGEVNSNEELQQRFLDHSEFPIYRASTPQFRMIPGSPIAFWVTDQMRRGFATGKALSDCTQMRKGLATGDNGRFLRHWHEVSQDKFGRNYSSREEASRSGRKWFPHNKGGEARKWFGNLDYVINWESDGVEIRNFRSENGRLRSRPQNLEYSFKQALTWSKITIGAFTARFCEGGCLFDDAAAIGHSMDRPQLYRILPILNSKIGLGVLQSLNPTVNLQIGDISRTPIIELGTVAEQKSLEERTQECVSIARADWDNFETSWDFRDQPLLRSGLKGATLEASWRNWEAKSTAAIRRMQEVETGNNRLFIDAYGLQDELKPEVPEEQITLVRPDRRKDMAAFLSYTVGCMMGRYSIDAPGLILVNAGDNLEHYLTRVGKQFDQLTFTSDADGILPVLDGAWFEDDIVARTRDFLRATFGETTLEENIRFIEESLGKDLRKYFLTDFYKDHLQTYKKRPIYWLFQSPKKGFSALIYLHRYAHDTVNVLLNGYLRDYLHKLRSRIEHLEHVQATGENAREKTAARKESDTLKKTLRECEEYERDILLPLAQQRIELDLDDGVKVNYLKFGKALAPIPGLAAKEEDG